MVILAHKLMTIIQINWTGPSRPAIFYSHSCASCWEWELWICYSMDGVTSCSTRSVDRSTAAASAARASAHIRRQSQHWSSFLSPVGHQQVTWYANGTTQRFPRTCSSVFSSFQTSVLRCDIEWASYRCSCCYYCCFYWCRSTSTSRIWYPVIYTD